MKQDKEVLINHLQSFLSVFKQNKKQVLALDGFLAEHSVKRGTINEIIINSDALGELEPEVLCLVTIGLFNITMDESIDPDLFYNESEIITSKRYVADEEEKIEYPVEIPNVIKLNGTGYTEYLTKMSTKEINKYHEAGVLNYRFETQRTAKQHKKKDGSIIQRPDVNRKSVKKIAELLLSKQYKVDTITFNVLFDEFSELNYNEREGTLVLENGKLDILDGFHRIEAISLALEKNPDLDIEFPVTIRYYDISDARNFFGQVNTYNPVDKPRVKQLKNERVSDNVVNELDKKSELSGRISSKTRVSNEQIVNFTNFADAIDEAFNPKDRKDFLDITPFLRDFFGYLIGSFKVEFVEKFKETKEVSWINHPNVFAGYIFLAKRFYDEEIPFRKLSTVLKSIDFSKENSPLSDILNTVNRDNSFKVRKKMKEFFEKITIE